MGCFTQSSDILSELSMNSTSLTPTTCKAWCGANNYKFAGLSDALTCACANDVSAMTTAAAAQCNLPCAGSAKLTCGGHTAFSVYQATTADTCVTAPGVKRFDTSTLRKRRLSH